MEFDDEWEPREPRHDIVGTDAWEETEDGGIRLPANTTLEDEEDTAR